MLISFLEDLNLVILIHHASVGNYRFVALTALVVNWVRDCLIAIVADDFGSMQEFNQSLSPATQRQGFSDLFEFLAL